MTELTRRIIEAVQAVPAGKVCSYGGIAARAGNPRASRQVVRVLHSYSSSMNLPWHRVLGSDGRIRLGPGSGLEEQCSLLIAEGVEVKIAPGGREARVDRSYFLQ